MITAQQIPPLVKKFPPPRVIAVDVDGTLHRNSLLNADLMSWLAKQKAKGFTVMLWSSGGSEYARKTAQELGVLNFFDLICSKPGAIVDDQAWNWIRYTRVVRSFTENL